MADKEYLNAVVKLRDVISSFSKDQFILMKKYDSPTAPLIYQWTFFTETNKHTIEFSIKDGLPHTIAHSVESRKLKAGATINRSHDMFSALYENSSSFDGLMKSVLRAEIVQVQQRPWSHIDMYNWRKEELN